MKKNSKVLLDWMGEISWKEQSVVISSLRGPDNLYTPNIKKLIRWMRGATQNNADPKHSYMQIDELPSFEEIEHEIAFCSMHYVTHLLHGLEIIGYKHSDKSMAKIARNYYLEIVKEFFHLYPETEIQMDTRLQDKV
jgi:hypothetical protein